ncbi:MAG: Ltp family lipoprotein [Clostridia bacterium]|nr:Ltp family lipoprotein [Clostridia bacterium]
MKKVFSILVSAIIVVSVLTTGISAYADAGTYTPGMPYILSGTVGERGTVETPIGTVDYFTLTTESGDVAVTREMSLFLTLDNTQTGPISDVWVSYQAPEAGDNIKVYCICSGIAEELGMDLFSFGSPKYIIKDKPAGQTAEPTTAEKNALQSAKDYLNVKAFSYDGLVKQLEFSGYTHEQAVYGADNCGADWFEQAVKSGKEYLDVMAFSRDRLISQLEYSGFTHEQAVYGADKNGL